MSMQVPMHHRTYTSTEAMTTAQVTVQCFMFISIFKLQATQISTVTSQLLQALPCNYVIIV